MSDNSPVSTGRILTPVDEENRREVVAAAQEILASIHASLDPDMPVRYDPLNQMPTVTARTNGPRFFHAYDRPRHRSITKRRVYKQWGRWVVLAGLLTLNSCQHFHARANGLEIPVWKRRKVISIMSSTISGPVSVGKQYTGAVLSHTLSTLRALRAYG